MVIKNILCRNNKNLTISLKPMTNVKSLLCNNKDIINKMDQCGVYKLKCDNCDAIYIGKTIRHFKTRIQEHITNSNQLSHFGNHLKDLKHTFNKDTNTMILHTESNYKKINNLEILEIQKAMDNRLNILNQQNSFVSSNLFRIYKDI